MWSTGSMESMDWSDSTELMVIARAGEYPCCETTIWSDFGAEGELRLALGLPRWKVIFRGMVNRLVSRGNRVVEIYSLEDVSCVNRSVDNVLLCT